MIKKQQAKTEELESMGKIRTGVLSVTCYGDCRKPQCIVHLNMEGRILNVLTTKDKMNEQWVRAALVAATVTVMATGTKSKP